MLPSVSVAPRLAVRVRPGNANHHLWLNNGTWFIHLWFHEGLRKCRFRASLGTCDLAVARERRDSVLAELRRCVPAPLATGLRDWIGSFTRTASPSVTEVWMREKRP
jgi:hypothetical protein